jgi:hypothetical protein
MPGTSPDIAVALKRKGDIRATGWIGQPGRSGHARLVIHVGAGFKPALVQQTGATRLRRARVVRAGRITQRECLASKFARPSRIVARMRPRAAHRAEPRPTCGERPRISPLRRSATAHPGLPTNIHNTWLCDCRFCLTITTNCVMLMRKLRSQPGATHDRPPRARDCKVACCRPAIRAIGADPG